MYIAWSMRYTALEGRSVEEEERTNDEISGEDPTYRTHIDT